MPIKQNVPEISEMSEDYQLVYRLGMSEKEVKEMWCINQLDVKSGGQDASLN